VFKYNTTDESDEDGRDSNDSRASTPPRTEHVWVALYSVEHEIERGRLLHQLRHELEGSNLLTFASLLMFDFMESARVQNSEELNFWREEIRLSLIQQSALPPEEMMTRREERMAWRILGCSVPPFSTEYSAAPCHRFSSVCPQQTNAHVALHLVRSQLKGVMLSTWEREDSWTPPPNNRQEFFQQVNQRLQNKFAMRQLGGARNGSSSFLFLRASRIWAHLARYSVYLLYWYTSTNTDAIWAHLSSLVIAYDPFTCINWASV
jgi:hypothetical protein